MGPRTSLLLTPHFLRRPQAHQQIIQQLIARLLIAQSRDEAEDVTLVSRVLGLFHVESMDVMVGVVCQAEADKAFR